MDSATTSRFSSVSRAMPISVSVPNWMIILSLLVPGPAPPLLTNSFWSCRFTVLDDSRSAQLLLARPDGRQLDHVVGVEIGQLEPVFRDVGWREQIVLGVLLLQGEQKVG